MFWFNPLTGSLESFIRQQIVKYSTDCSYTPLQLVHEVGGQDLDQCNPLRGVVPDLVVTTRYGDIASDAVLTGHDFLISDLNSSSHIAKLDLLFR